MVRLQLLQDELLHRVRGIHKQKTKLSQSGYHDQSDSLCITHLL
jgi:hypothetical protein